MTWLFPRLDAATGAAGAYDARSPFRVVFHTTEIDSHPATWVPAWRSPSHVVADPKRRVIVQCVPLDQAAKALWNEPGGVETNRARAIQIELNMRSPATPQADPLTDDDYRWLGEQVLRPILDWCAAQRSPIDVGMIPPVGAIPMSATVSAPQRMTFEAWEQFDGICSHRHVPENDHWDSGCVDLHRIAAYAAGDLGGATIDPPTPPTAEDDDTMPTHLLRLPTGAVVAAFASGVVRTIGGAEYAHFTAKSIPLLQVSDPNEANQLTWQAHPTALDVRRIADATVPAPRIVA